VKRSNNRPNNENEEYIGSVHSETMKRILSQWQSSDKPENSDKLSWLPNQPKKK